MACGRITRTLEIDEPRPTQKLGRKPVSRTARHQQHRARTIRDVVIGNKSRPLALSASSQEDSGCVAPALATIASTGSNGVLAPSA